MSNSLYFVEVFFYETFCRVHQKKKSSSVRERERLWLLGELWIKNHKQNTEILICYATTNRRNMELWVVSSIAKILIHFCCTVFFFFSIWWKPISLWSFVYWKQLRITRREGIKTKLCVRMYVCLSIS
jgi:hypothetical protein